MVKKVLRNIRSVLVGGVILTSLAYLPGCSIDVLTDDEYDSGLSAGVHQIADGVMNIIDYFDD